MILIDMPMPTNCLECPACNEYLTCAIPVSGRKWGENDVREFSQSRPDWCPLKEQEAVEPYMDYDGQNVWRYGKCGNSLMHPSYYESDENAKNNIKYCSHCGRKVKLDV